jgi:hypothetical protein
VALLLLISFLNLQRNNMSEDILLGVVPTFKKDTVPTDAGTGSESNSNSGGGVVPDEPPQEYVENNSNLLMYGGAALLLYYFFLRKK